MGILHLNSRIELRILRQNPPDKRKDYPVKRTHIGKSFVNIDLRITKTSCECKYEWVCKRLHNSRHFVMRFCIAVFDTRLRIGKKCIHPRRPMLEPHEAYNHCLPAKRPDGRRAHRMNAHGLAWHLFQNSPYWFFD